MARRLFDADSPGMHLIYFDESGNSGSNLNDPLQPVFVMGALVVPEACWRQLEVDLEKAIEDHFPDHHAAGIEIHGTDLRNTGKGPFAGVKREARDALRDAWLDVAAAHKLTFFYRAIRKSAYLTAMKERLEHGDKIDPQVPAFILLAQRINAYLVNNKFRGIFISDTCPGKDQATENAIRWLRLSPGVLQLTNVIEKGFFIDSAKSRILQLCDVCTLYARKGYEIRLGVKAGSAATAASDVAGAAKVKTITELGSDPRFNDMIEWLKRNQAGRPSK